MIGRMIDINYHLITETGHPPPPDYHASFSRLGDLKILEPELARRIARCAGLRNRLVHEYDEIDPQKVFESLQAARADMPAYLRQELSQRQHAIMMVTHQRASVIGPEPPTDGRSPRGVAASRAGLDFLHSFGPECAGALSPA